MPLYIATGKGKEKCFKKTGVMGQRVNLGTFKVSMINIIRQILVMVAEGTILSLNLLGPSLLQRSYFEL